MLRRAISLRDANTATVHTRWPTGEEGPVTFRRRPNGRWWRSVIGEWELPTDDRLNRRLERARRKWMRRQDA